MIDSKKSSMTPGSLESIHAAVLYGSLDSLNPRKLGCEKFARFERIQTNFRAIYLLSLGTLNTH